MRLKVYRKLNGVTEYWESWQAAGEAFVHRGRIGDPGETQRFSMKEPGNARRVIEEVEKVEKAGFKPISFEDCDQIVIHYRLEQWGSVEDHTRRVEIEDQMNACLGRTCLGYCDGGEIGSGSVNVFCEVLDAAIAEPVIVNDLREHGKLEGAVIAKRERKGDDAYKVIWPKDFVGAFNLF
jgi:hypothetical protein